MEHDKQLDQPEILKVLVIDDNKPYASGLAELLEMGGFEASYVLTGGDGLESAQRLDVGCGDSGYEPADMNGFEVCRKLRRDPKTAHIAVVFHTTKGSVPGARHEADAFLGFPIPMSEVYTVIRGKRGEAALAVLF